MDAFHYSTSLLPIARMFTFCKQVLIFFRRKSEPSKFWFFLAVNAEKRASASRSSSYLPKHMCEKVIGRKVLPPCAFQHAVIAFIAYGFTLAQCWSAPVNTQCFRSSTVCSQSYSCQTWATTQMILLMYNTDCTVCTITTAVKYGVVGRRCPERYINTRTKYPYWWHT